MIKTVDAIGFNKIKAIREVNNYESDNFEMDIIDEGALDKALVVTKNNLYPPSPVDNL